MQNAELEFREAAIRAVAEGVPVMHVAKALDLSRTSLYRWGVAQSGLNEKRGRTVATADPMTAQGEDHEQHTAKYPA